MARAEGIPEAPPPPDTSLPADEYRLQFLQWRIDTLYWYRGVEAVQVRKFSRASRYVQLAMLAFVVGMIAWFEWKWR